MLYVLPYYYLQTTAMNRLILVSTRKSSTLSYDAIVIGGGSGGLAFSKASAALGAKVALVDAVEPSPHGTTWGLGGCCANVGCIPKKLMHIGALLGKDISQADKYGWKGVPTSLQHDWNTLSKVVNDRIKANNWIYRVQLNEKNIKYYNAFGSFVDSGTIKTVANNKKKTEILLKAPKIVVATGLRPRYPAIPGAEHGITSDDVFTLPRAPGKTLVVGAGYVALETAGLLKGLGHEVHLLVRSKPLRGFDKGCVDLVMTNLRNHGVEILQDSEVKSVTKNGSELKVNFTNANYSETSFNTVIWAMGREPRHSSLNLQSIDMKLASSGKIVVKENDETSVGNVFAVGDVAEDRPELTPTAIKAGQLLAARLFGNSKQLMNYNNVATTVFTPLEFSTIGLSEEEAIKKYGQDNLEVYHSHFVPFEYIVPQDEDSAQCYAKVICKRNDARDVLGIHIVSPNAAEIMQGYAVAFRKGITFEDIEGTVAIHPCTSEEIVKLSITKRSGLSPVVKGCCG